MKTFTRDYKLKEYNDEVFNEYFGGLKGCVFDIETTGLSSKSGRAKVILTAMLIPTESGVRVTQYLAEDPFEEDRVIARTMEFFAEHEIDYLITYNGASFDIPFMRDRIEQLHLPYEINMYNLDLYTFLKRYSVLPAQLESMKQKSVEYYYGLSKSREDVIDGGQSVKLYFEYVTSHSSVLEKVILTHNREDVVQLYKILHSAGYNHFAGTLKDDMDLHTALAKYGLPAGTNACLSAQPQLTRTRMRIRGRQRLAPKFQDITIRANADERPSRVYYMEETDESSRSAAIARGSRDSGDSLNSRDAFDFDGSLDSGDSLMSRDSLDSGDSLMSRYAARYPLNSRLFPSSDEEPSIEFTAGTHSFQIELPLMKHGDSLYCPVDIYGDALLAKHGIYDLGGYVNGFLILVDETAILQREINTLTALLCEYAASRAIQLM